MANRLFIAQHVSSGVMASSRRRSISGNSMRCSALINSGSVRAILAYRFIFAYICGRWHTRILYWRISSMASGAAGGMARSILLA